MFVRLPARGRRAGRASRQVRPQLRLERLEDRRLLSITEFALPASGGQAPQGIAAGPDGNLWFAMTYFAPGIGMINPTTDAITEFPSENSNDFPEEVAAGPDGSVWFTGFNAVAESHYVGTINPTTGAYSEFTIENVGSGNGSPRGITAGPDGNLWFTDPYGNAIGMISPTTHVITEFALPTPNADPRGIAVGPDGNLWFAEWHANQIGMINPTTHAITEFAVPTAGSQPFFITAGADGNLWFTEYNANQIGEIDPTTHAIAEFAVPTANAGLAGITPGANGNLWFIEQAVGQIGEINPATHAVTEFTVPYSGTSPYEITAGPDESIWFSDDAPPTGAIGVDTLNADHFVVTQQPATSVAAGTGFGLTVDAEDSSGNLDSSFNGTVTVALANNPGGTTLGGTLSVTASNGIATLSGLTLTKAASGYTLAVSASGVDGATTSAITVTPAAATQLVITQQPPGSVIIGSGFGLQASIEDPYDNVETGDSAVVTVALANNPAGATLGGTLSAAASQGVAAFSGLTLDQVASGYTLEVSSAGLTNATTGAITVTRVPATQLGITQQPPSNVTAGTSFGLTVQAEDSSGEFASTFNGTVTVALANNPVGATLGGTLTATASDGVATFSALTLNKAAAGYTFLVSSSALGSATTSAVTVNPAAASQLLITQPPPSSVTAGSGFGLQATIEDPYHNVETGDSGTVTVALENNPTGATLGGTLSVAASHGLASFSGLTLTAAESGYTLQVSSGTLVVTTGAITVTPAAPAKLIVVTEPPHSLTAGAAFGLTVDVDDPFGNVAAWTGNVTVAIAAGPGGATLGGQTTMTASGGMATFAGPVLTHAGSYTLAATSALMSRRRIDTVTRLPRSVALSPLAAPTARWKEPRPSRPAVALPASLA
jgi:streptogramin lyase